MLFKYKVFFISKYFLTFFLIKICFQYFIIISDGHGQEYWNNAQAAGRQLQETKANIFAATSSVDFNMAELALYTGNEKHVYVGSNYKKLVVFIFCLFCNKNLQINLF